MVNVQVKAKDVFIIIIISRWTNERRLLWPKDIITLGYGTRVLYMLKNSWDGFGWSCYVVIWLTFKFGKNLLCLSWDIAWNKLVHGSGRVGSGFNSNYSPADWGSNLEVFQMELNPSNYSPSLCIFSPPKTPPNPTTANPTFGGPKVPTKNLQNILCLPLW